MDICQIIQNALLDTEQKLEAYRREHDENVNPDAVVRLLNNRIAELRDALKRCRDKPPTGPFIAIFTGNAAIRTDVAGFGGPYNSFIRFPITFSDDFSIPFVAGLTFSFAKGNILVKQTAGGIGFFSFSGRMSLPMTLAIMTPFGDTTVDLPPPGFTTEQADNAGQFSPHGVRLNRTDKTITLAAAGTSMGGNFGGQNVEAILTGSLDNIPLAYATIPRAPFPRGG
jgi:hypothetical protein